MTAIGSEFVDRLSTALKKNEQVYLADETTLQVRPMGLWSRFWHWGDKKYHEKRMDALAGGVAKVLAAQERVELGEVEDLKAVELAVLLKTKIKSDKPVETEGVKSMRKEVSALLLGIYPRIFERNPGFQEFEEKFHLSPLLRFYGGEVKVNPRTLKVSLKKDGEYVAWEEIKPEIEKWAEETKPTEPWIYGMNGIHFKDRYKWTKLEAHAKEEPTGKYWYRRWMCKNPDTKIGGVHTWCDIVTPEGEVSEAGKYAQAKRRWGKMGLLDYFTLLETQPARIQSPDCSRVWPKPLEKVMIPREITQEGFEKIKARIEEFKAIENDPEKGLVYHQYNNSCMDLSEELEGLAGIKIEGAASTPKAIMSKRDYGRIEAVYSRMPRFIQKICDVVSTVFWNSLQWLFGTNNCHPSLNPYQRSCARQSFRGIQDLLREDLNLLRNPAELMEQHQSQHRGSVHA